MAGYFEEMGWRELQDGESPDHLLHMARFMLDFGLHDDNFTGEWPRFVHTTFRGTYPSNTSGYGIRNTFLSKVVVQ